MFNAGRIRRATSQQGRGLELSHLSSHPGLSLDLNWPGSVRHGVESPFEPNTPATSQMDAVSLPQPLRDLQHEGDNFLASKLSATNDTPLGLEAAFHGVHVQSNEAELPYFSMEDLHWLLSDGSFAVRSMGDDISYIDTLQRSEDFEMWLMRAAQDTFYLGLEWDT
ncbi:hypothetical protein BDW71DRAFT_203114 [Aspergillus fruticulosus]